MIKFAHLADCHLDGWRDARLKELSMQAFEYAIDYSIKEKVDFIIIAGDLFDGSTPDINIQLRAVKKIKEAKDLGIPTYIIAGSHDISYSNKTILTVLEAADLFRNVMQYEESEGRIKLKFITDKRTGARMCGLLGKKGSLETKYYEKLDKEELEKEEGFKIFIFHSGIAEYLPPYLKDTESISLSLLPKGFDYYAGGHIHTPLCEKPAGYGVIVQTGATFPTEFKELEEFRKGFFAIALYDGKKIEARQVEIEPKKIVSINIDGNNKTAEEIEKETEEAIKKLDCRDKVVLLRYEGVMGAGKPSDINFNMLDELLMSKGAYSVQRTRTKLEAKEFEKIEVKGETIEEMEKNLVEEQLSKMDLGVESEENLTHNVINVLNRAKGEEETAAQFETEVIKHGLKALKIEKMWENEN